MSLLRQIQEFFGGVGVITQKENKIAYRVKSLTDLTNIISHFDKYPLISNKCADYELFKLIVQIMVSKEHLTEQGLRKVLSIKASLNNGLSEQLKIDFPDLLPVPRPLINQTIKDPS